MNFLRRWTWNGVFSEQAVVAFSGPTHANTTCALASLALALGPAPAAPPRAVKVVKFRPPSGPPLVKTVDFVFASGGGLFPFVQSISFTYARIALGQPYIRSLRWVGATKRLHCLVSVGRSNGCCVPRPSNSPALPGPAVKFHRPSGPPAARRQKRQFPAGPVKTTSGSGPYYRGMCLSGDYVIPAEGPWISSLHTVLHTWLFV